MVCTVGDGDGILSENTELLATLLMFSRVWICSIYRASSNGLIDNISAKESSVKLCSNVNHKCNIVITSFVSV